MEDRPRISQTSLTATIEKKNPKARTEGPQASCVHVWSVLSVDYAVQTVVLDSLCLLLSSVKPVLTRDVQDFALHIKKAVLKT